MKRIFLSIALLLLSLLLPAQEIERIEPPCWWTGMNTNLQLMLYGRGLRDATVSLANPEQAKGISVGKVHKADSRNYLFVDIKIGLFAKPGDYTFVVKSDKGETEFTYTIKERAKGSSRRNGFTSADMIYLLMPDRFANGDSRNDSDRSTSERGNRDDLGGRHGGDIQGIIDHLDYLEELGVTTIWPTPLLLDNEKRYSYHGYACADYYSIDPRYGDNELYCEFVQKAHKRDMKVIMDVVLNHCGTAHWWMEDLPFEDWIHSFKEFTRSNYMMSTQADPHASKADLALCIDGWFDRTMPDMNLGNKYLRQYLVQNAVWWIEYADLDGLRVDTYPYTLKEEVAEWTKAVLAEYPNLSIVGECWLNDVLSVSYWDGNRKQNDGFCSHLTSVMDFPLREELIKVFSEEADEPNSISRIYGSIAQDYAYKDPNTLMIFASNHDTQRLAHDLDGDIDRIKNVMTILATMRGIPQLYYGDELALRSLDGTTGHSQERVDFPGGWREDKEDLFNRRDRSEEQKYLYDHISTLFQWRKSSAAVTKGDMTHFIPEDDVYVYFRHVRKELVMVVVNNGKSSYDIDWDRFKEMTQDRPKKGTDIITGKYVSVGEEVTVKPQSSMVIQFK